MSFQTPYKYLVEPDQVREALASFADQPLIGLDTETYWDGFMRENRLSLLQLAAPTGEVVVVDALASGVEQARSLLENPEVIMAAHNARFDEGVLQQAGFSPAGFVDTLRLSRRTLKLRSCALASVSEHLFGVRLDKTLQQSDWRRRPLTRAQLDYAALDAQVALQVYEALAERLRQEGRWEPELRRARLSAKAEASDESRRRKTPGLQLRPLTADERQVVERLKVWRRQMAEHEHLPAYMICADRTLEHLAIARPRSLADLERIYGLGPAKVGKYGVELISQLD